MTKGKRSGLWAIVVTLIAALAMPAAALAQGRGRGRGQDKSSQQQRKNEKFKNGHDARDGRWDGRGPNGRDDDNDYNDDNYGRRRNDRGSYGTYDRTEVRRVAADRGYNDGYRAGQDDRSSGRGVDYNDHSSYRDATNGYRNEYGSVDYYRNSYREAFRQGYQDGYRNRSTRSGRWGNILGGILGRP